MGDFDDDRERTASDKERGRDDDVTASEVASYAFCAKAWHLEHVLGRRPSTAAVNRREAGARQHAAHGMSLLAAQRSRLAAGLVAFFLAVCAVVFFVLAIVLFI